MKALDKYFVMVMFSLLLNRIHIFAILICNLYVKFEQRNIAVK